MIKDITQFQLSNGLSLFLKEIHTAPVVSVWTWYDIGSRNEVSTKTGLSHWVEHMQFKGTKTMSGQEMDHAIARVGGYWNAFTSSDWTTYLETLPADQIDLALKIEADRMQNSLFSPEDVEMERTVILSEREGAENDPLFLLGEATEALAFETHPYRNEVLGLQADIETITRDDLYGHYKAYYQPSNARLCIAGDFDTTEIIQKIETWFGEIPSKPVQKVIPEPEGPINKLHRVEMEGPGDAHFAEILYRCPAGNTEDFFACTILDSLLAGPSSLNMFGSGNISNRTSRLYKALVETEIVAGVFAGINATIDPGSYGFTFIARPDRDSEQVLKAFDQQMEAIQNGDIQTSELERAVKQARALFVYGSDNITNQAFWLGYAPSFADYNWFTQYIERLQAVTANDVIHVAQKYFDANQRVIGFYNPVKRA